VHRSLATLAAASIAFAPGGWTFCNADWVPNGNAVCSAPGDQVSHSACSDGQGGVFVVWRDLLDPTAAYATRMAADGTLSPGWTPNGVRVTTGAMGTLHLTPDDEGGIYIGWSTGAAFYVQRLGANGQVVPGWSPGGRQLHFVPSGISFPTMTADGEHGLFVSWREWFQNCGDHGCFNYTSGRVRRFGPDGAPDPAYPVEGAAYHTTVEFTGYTSYFEGPTLAARGGPGSIYLAWSENRLYEFYSAGYVARINAGYSYDVGGAYSRWPTPPLALVPAPGGRVVCAFRGSFSDGSLPPFCFVQREPDGYPTSAFQGVHIGPPGFDTNVSSVASDESDGTFVAWTQLNDGSSLASSHVIRLGPDGSPSSGWPVSGHPNATTTGFQVETRLASDGSGGVIYAWLESRTGSLDVFWSHRNSTGELPSPGFVDGQVLCDAPGDQREVQLVQSAPGTAIAVWVDRRAGNWDVYATKVGPDYPVPSSASIVNAGYSAGAARLTWWVVDGAGSDVVIERRSESSDWGVASTALVDGSGIVRYEDHGAGPGARYGYRLGIVEQGVERFFGEAWVTIPRADFALEGLTPNPTTQVARAAFTLPDDTPATLELLDIGGRLLARHDVGMLGVGRHIVDAGAGIDLAPGMYVVRLTRAGAVLTARGAVVR
jgi:hypothetical protein